MRPRTVAVLAALTVCSVLVPASARAADPYPYISNDVVWNDISGNEIKAQGGSVLKVGSTYYWVGTEMNGGSYAFAAVNLYKSTDLERWTFVKAVLTPQASGDLAAGNWVGRPDLIYNSTTGRYIVVVEVQSTGGYVGSFVGFASSSTVEGTYTYQGSSAVNGSSMGDHSVFVDGSNAYLVYDGDNATTRNVTLNIAPLASNWLSVGSAIYSETNSGREAPFIMKVGSTYHWFASGMNWWDSTATQHRSGTSLTSWGAWSTVATVPSSTNSFNTQFDFIVPVTGSSGTAYLYAGDRYTNFLSSGNPAPTGVGRNAWYQLTFSGSTPTIHGFTDLKVDASAGTVTGNYVANGKFDQSDPTQNPPLWSEALTAADSFTESGGYTGDRLTHRATAAYQAYTYQILTLPNGSYTLSALVTSSGGQTNAAMQVKSYGGADLSVLLNTAMSAWTTKSVTFTVTTGTAQIAFWSNAAANQWLSVDNVTVWPN
jgi:hypothetical protein